MFNRPLIVSISAGDARRIFNARHFWERTKNGELQTRVIVDKHPSAPRSNEPVCTRSQVLSYHDDRGYRVAIVHQYLRRNGEIGASGRPDPKLLLIDGIVYQVLG